jgi:hypothetical protein
MDKLNQYRQIQYAAMSAIAHPEDEMEEQLILDTERDHYQILTIGWEGTQRVYHPVFHLDIKNDKIWVQ